MPLDRCSDGEVGQPHNVRPGQDRRALALHDHMEPRSIPSRLVCEVGNLTMDALKILEILKMPSKKNFKILKKKTPKNEKELRIFAIKKMLAIDL